MTPLSPRQRQCLALLADGHTDASMAQQLHITVDTVHRHVEDLRFKLGAANRAHAVALGFRTGVLP